jgi:DNA invertase Pin-like site-specific DNA recombinase
MLERLMSNGARTILVESPDRFARELMVQLAGHDMLKAKGISFVAPSAPTHFVEDTPTANLVRQVLGAIAEFEKTRVVAKLAAAAPCYDRACQTQSALTVAHNQH